MNAILTSLILLGMICGLSALCRMAWRALQRWVKS